LAQTGLSVELESMGSLHKAFVIFGTTMV
jgi:hypothetical protein